MNLKDLIFGGGVKSGGDGGTYRDSIQAWLPPSKISSVGLSLQRMADL